MLIIKTYLVTIYKFNLAHYVSNKNKITMKFIVSNYILNK